MLVEDDRAHVRLLDHHVDDGEVGVGELRRHGLHRRAVGEAGDDDRVVAALGEAAQRLLALGVVLQLELLVGDAGLGLEALGALEGGLVERAVELAAEVEDDRRVGVLGLHGGGRHASARPPRPGSLRTSWVNLQGTAAGLRRPPSQLRPRCRGPVQRARLSKGLSPGIGQWFFGAARAGLRSTSASTGGAPARR